MDWPSTFSDLNLVESIWRILTHYDFHDTLQYQIIEQLSRKVLKIWSLISNEDGMCLLNAERRHSIPVLQNKKKSNVY